MNPSASNPATFEEQATEEVARHGLLYAEKQMLKANQYRELITAFRNRSAGTMLVMGVLALLHAGFAIVYFGTADGPDSSVWQALGNRWGRPLMCAAFMAMSFVAWRDVRRCARILATDEDDPAV